jgi:hypothetical protein
MTSAALDSSSDAEETLADRHDEVGAMASATLRQQCRNPPRKATRYSAPDKLPGSKRRILSDNEDIREKKKGKVLVPAGLTAFLAAVHLTTLANAMDNIDEDNPVGPQLLAALIEASSKNAVRCPTKGWLQRGG